MAHTTIEDYATTFNQWLVPDLADHDPWIGVFENQDFGMRRNEWRKVAFAFRGADWAAAGLGFTCAPDHEETGPGWRYVLVAKVRTVGEAMRAMEE